MKKHHLQYLMGIIQDNKTLSIIESEGVDSFIIQVGDMLGRYSHSVIVTEHNGNLCYHGHSSNRLNMPIEYFRDSFNRYRIIQVSNPE